MGDSRPKPRQRRRLRPATLLLGVCLVVYCVLFITSPSGSGNQETSAHSPLTSNSKRLTPELLNNLSLHEDECNTAFPGLTKDIDDAVGAGPFKLKQAGELGPLQGRIKDGQIYILNARRKADLSQEWLNSRTAALHQLYRAILTSPTPLPDTVFTLNYHDEPFGTAWSYSRAADALLRSKNSNTRAFLMPHFSFWAWNLPFIGSMGRAARAIAELEKAYQKPGQWQRKISKAVWRGTSWFNSAQSPRLRQNLVKVARGKPWADVETLQWVSGKGGSGRNASNALPVEEFCRYKYVIHTEGVAYSGRFQFLQMCASVVLTPPINWVQHTTHLVRPLFSSDLDLESTAARNGSPPPRRWTPTERTRKTWPVQYRPEEANIVFVDREWADLEATVAWLEDHPDIAEGIARRQRELFVGGGYFSPAAEACYWRALVRGWAKVARTDGEGWEDAEGMAFEAFALGLDME